MVDAWQELLFVDEDQEGFQTLLNHLGTIVRNQCRIPGADANAPPMEIATTPNAKQKRAYELLDSITV